MMTRIPETVVIAGLDPAIHLSRVMDGRVEPGHDVSCVQ
jgi:hypothetical protein